MEILVKILNVIRNVIFVALLLLILWVSYNVYFDMILDILDKPFRFGLLCCLIWQRLSRYMYAIGPL